MPVFAIDQMRKLAIYSYRACEKNLELLLMNTNETLPKLNFRRQVPHENLKPPGFNAKNGITLSNSGCETSRDSPKPLRKLF